MGVRGPFVEGRVCWTCSSSCTLSLQPFLKHSLLRSRNSHAQGHQQGRSVQDLVNQAQMRIWEDKVSRTWGQAYLACMCVRCVCIAYAPAYGHVAVQHHSYSRPLSPMSLTSQAAHSYTAAPHGLLAHCTMQQCSRSPKWGSLLSRALLLTTPHTRHVRPCAHACMQVNPAVQGDYGIQSLSRVLQQYQGDAEFLNAFYE